MSSELLAQLDKAPKVKMFDAFPKTRSMYTQRSSRGGALTLLVSVVLLCLVWNDVRDYLYGEHGYSFEVDQKVGTEMQVNLDITVAMKCHYLTIDVRDAVGDRLHISDSEFTKDGTTFEIGHAGRLDSVPAPDLSVGRTIDAAKKVKVPTFRKKAKPAKRSSAFKKTGHVVKDGPACRIFGSMEVKKVTGNFHITTLGHGYWSWEHTDHALMNLSHVVHEFSFGPYFPDISQPLDSSVEITNEHFSVFQYFVNIVPTNYIDSRGRKLSTNQYSVTDYTRTVQHGQGVPGIFIKYDMEPLTMTIRERTTSFVQFVVRLAGVLGGVWVCTSWAFRVTSKIGVVASDALKSRDDLKSPESYANAHGTRPVSQYGGVASFNNNRPQYGDQRSTSGRWLDGAAQGGVEIFSSAREKAGQAWGNIGRGHRTTDSVQQRIFSEEGRQPW